jgi:hypothetical protein
MLARLTVLALAATFSLMAAITVTAPASATPYTNSTSPSYCRANATDTPMRLPRTITATRVRGTSDFKVDSNGYSFRTCYWRAGSGSFNYVCPSRNNANGWTLELVTRAATHRREALRWAIPIVCDGRVHGYGYTNFDPSWQTHFHIHDPTDCGPRRFLPDRSCPVLGSFQLTIDRPRN